MNLKVIDRLSLLNLLPKEGDITTLRVVRELRESLSFTEDEHKALAFRTTETGEIEWAASADTERDFDFAPKAVGIIVESLQKADRSKKLTFDCLGVYEKFMEEA